ncbi:MULTISPECIES: glycosyltransferase family 2 protein [unclassified Clostridium]|uniref:glycosyltransferase family 2 protein n=1 Tax=unclassified Clostridium TaxID=2614128 RepID=UPI0002985200|nr:MULTISPECIES: glycosyltransferase family 2 protein [unclassified Clostridium]EKQ53632.1 MAG: glycosyl transferase [Clostridium sp. Maddingley MBC34-26]
MKYLIIVPAYNEAKNIFNVVTSIKNNNIFADVVVINDGSKDNTYSEAKRAGAEVINLSENLGIGGAVQTGYIYALKKGYEVAVQIDGDGQHDPKDLENLIKQMEESNFDMIIGSRFIEKTNYIPSKFRAMGIRYFSKLVSLLCRSNYYDTTSGYRLINKKGISLFAKYYPKDYPEVETIVYACKNDLRVKEISVNMRQRYEGKSSITPIKSIYYMIKVTLSTLIIAKKQVY